MKDLVILINSFDGYSDVWPVFFYFFDKNWSDCKFQSYLVTNNLDYKDVNVIKTGSELCWTDRTLKAVKQINAEYILLLLEDYLIWETVNNDEIEQCINFLKEKNGKYLRLTNIPKSRFNNDKRSIYEIYADEEYGINLQASIWKKDYLIENLEKYAGDAWQFEISILKNSIDQQHIKLCDCFAMEYDPLHIKNGVLKGKWFPKVVKFCKKEGVLINCCERDRLKYTNYFIYYIGFFLKNNISYTLRKKIKKILKKLGFNFISDY